MAGTNTLEIVAETSADDRERYARLAELLGRKKLIAYEQCDAPMAARIAVDALYHEIADAIRSTL